MSKTIHSPQISFSIKQAAQITGFHRNTIGRAIREGALVAKVLGAKRVVILRTELHLWLDGLPEYGSQQREALPRKREK